MSGERFEVDRQNGRFGKRGSEGSVRDTLASEAGSWAFGLSGNWRGFLHVALDVT